MSLLERIQEVLDDKGWSARQWAKEAELSEPTHVVTLMRRLRENPGAAVDSQTIAKMADAANVSLDWLQLGRGTKEGAFVRVTPDARYPSRAVAVTAATLAGWSRDGIARVQGMDHFLVDPGVEVWMGLLRSECEGIPRLPPAPAPVPAMPQKRAQARKRR